MRRYRIIKKYNNSGTETYYVYIKKWYGWRQSARFSDIYDANIYIDNLHRGCVYEDGDIRVKLVKNKTIYPLNHWLSYRIQSRFLGVWFDLDFESRNLEETIKTAKNMVKEGVVIEEGYINK